MAFFQLYEDYTSETEVPPLFHKWCAISGIAATLGKSAYLQRGHFRIFPNLYVMLLGSPGTGKGTSITILQQLLLDSGYNTFAADKSSKEKFLVDFQDGFAFRPDDDTDGSGNIFAGGSGGIESYFRASPDEKEKTVQSALEGVFSDGSPCEVFVLAEEFNDFIGLNNTDFIALLTKLWSYTGTYRNRLKNSKSISIYEPCVNILGGNTSAGFAMAFPPEIMGQGFLARLLPIYGEPTGKRITFPKLPDQKLRRALGDILRDIRSRIGGEFTVTDDGKLLLDQVNQQWTPIPDLRFQHYSSRRFNQLLKLCIIHAAARLSTNISIEDIVDANTILSHTEDLMPKAVGEFGKARNSDVTSKIMEALYATAKPLTTTDLWKLCSSDLNSISELANILAGLSHADKIQSAGGGKGYLPKQVLRKTALELVSPAKKDKLL